MPRSLAQRIVTPLVRLTGIADEMAAGMAIHKMFIDRTLLTSSDNSINVKQVTDCNGNFAGFDLTMGSQTNYCEAQAQGSPVSMDGACVKRRKISLLASVYDCNIPAKEGEVLVLEEDCDKYYVALSTGVDSDPRINSGDYAGAFTLGELMKYRSNN